MITRRIVTKDEIVAIIQAKTWIYQLCQECGRRWRVRPNAVDTRCKCGSSKLDVE
jgi:hypothetical protein